MPVYLINKKIILAKSFIEHENIYGFIQIFCSYLPQIYIQFTYNHSNDEIKSQIDKKIYMNKLKSENQSEFTMKDKNSI